MNMDTACRRNELQSDSRTPGDGTASSSRSVTASTGISPVGELFLLPFLFSPSLSFLSTTGIATPDILVPSSAPAPSWGLVNYKPCMVHGVRIWLSPVCVRPASRDGTSYSWSAGKCSMCQSCHVKETGSPANHSSILSIVYLQ